MGQIILPHSLRPKSHHPPHPKLSSTHSSKPRRIPQHYPTPTWNWTHEWTLHTLDLHVAPPRGVRESLSASRQGGRRPSGLFKTHQVERDSLIAPTWRKYVRRKRRLCATPSTRTIRVKVDGNGDICQTRSSCPTSTFDEADTKRPPRGFHAYRRRGRKNSAAFRTCNKGGIYLYEPPGPRGYCILSAGGWRSKNCERCRLIY